MTPTQELTQDRFLGGKLELFQPRHGYRAGTDPVLLAASVPAARGESFLDLGCGVGVAGLCLAYRTGASGTGLELQPTYADLARRNAQATGLAFDVVEGDVHAMPAPLRARSFHHVLMNPPYFAEGSGTPADDCGRDLALRDRADLGAWMAAAARRVRARGTLSVIARADRLRDLLTFMPATIGSLRLLPLAARDGRPAKRVLLQGVKDGRAPMILLAPLVLHRGASHEADGDDFTPQAACILRQAGALALQAAKT